MTHVVAPTEPTLFGFSARPILILVAVLTWCGICSYVVSPRISGILLVLSVVMPSLWYFFRHAKLPRLALTPSLAVMLAFGVYLAINAGWSLAPELAKWIVLRHFLFALALVLTLQLLGEDEPEFLGRMLRAFVFAFALMAVVVLIEVVSQMALRRVINNWLPFTRSWDTNVLTIENGKVVELVSFLVNRNVAALSFLFWPAAYASRLMVTSSTQRAARWAMLAVAVFAVGWSIHESSQAALAAGAVTFVIARFSRSWAWRTLLAGWLTATLLVVPVALGFSQWSGIQQSSVAWSAKLRVVIWETTAKKVLERPWFGVGVGSTRVLDATDRPPLTKDDNPNLPPQVGVHAHNVYLQTWYELGFAGVLLLMLTGLTLLAWLRRVDDQAFPYAAAAFALAATLAAFSYSLTSPWFLASFGLSAIFMRLAIEGGDAKTSAAARQPITTRAKQNV